jgi:hypothetical protein
MGQSHNFWVVHFQYNVFSWPFSPGVFINFIAIKDKQIISTKVRLFIKMQDVCKLAEQIISQKNLENVEQFIVMHLHFKFELFFT